MSLTKKAVISQQQLFPANKRSEEAFETYFNKAGLKEIVDFQVGANFFDPIHETFIRLLFCNERQYWC